ncbi:unnamed protein product, partial [Iphiclides podalirius]
MGRVNGTTPRFVACAAEHSVKRRLPLDGQANGPSFRVKKVNVRVSEDSITQDNPASRCRRGEFKKVPKTMNNPHDFSPPYIPKSTRKVQLIKCKIVLQALNCVQVVSP